MVSICLFNHEILRSSQHHKSLTWKLINQLSRKVENRNRALHFILKHVFVHLPLMFQVKAECDESRPTINKSSVLNRQLLIKLN